MWNVSVAADLVGCVHDDDSVFLGQHAGGLTEHRRFAHARTSHKQCALARTDDVPDDVNRAVDGSTDATGQPHDLTTAVAHSRDTM